MDATDLIEQAQRWLARQTQLRAEAERLGDAQSIAAIDAEIAETESTIAQLQTLV